MGGGGDPFKFSKILIISFSKDANVTVKIFIMLHSILISNEYCSFEHFIHQGIQEMNESKKCITVHTSNDV